MFNIIPVERLPEECSTQHGFQSSKHLLVKTKQSFISTYSKNFYDEFNTKERKGLLKIFLLTIKCYSAQYSSVYMYVDTHVLPASITITGQTTYYLSLEYKQ